MEYYSVTNKKILPFVTAWVHFQGIMQRNKLEKDKYHISLICEIKKKKTEYIKQRTYWCLPEVDDKG